MAVVFNSNIYVSAPLNTDAKYGVWSGADINTAKANALAGVASGVRAIGMTVGLYVGGNTTEYWFKSGTTNADLVEKTSGSTVSSGNLITVSGSGEINFTGGTNAGGNIIVQNTSGNNFSFRSNDGVNAGLTILGNSTSSNSVLALNGTGSAEIRLASSSQFIFTTDSLNPNETFAYFIPQDFGVTSAFDFFSLGKALFGSDEAPQLGIIDAVSYSSQGGIPQLVANGFDIDAYFLFKPNSSGGAGDFYSYINNDGGNGLIFQYTGSNQAFFSSSNNFVFRGSILAGADSITTETPTATIEAIQTTNSIPNLKLSGRTTGDTASLQFAPFAGSDSYINFTNSGRLFFQSNGTSIAQFSDGATPNFSVYNNATIGRNHNPTEAKLEIYQTGNSVPNLKLFGLNSSDNARLDFAPANGIDAYINNTTNTKIFFWTNGSGTSYYDGGLFFFGSNLVQIQNALSSNQNSLLVNPSYSSTGNSAISISGSSIRATTRGLNIVSSYTGATSNAIYVGSAISASANLANAVNYNPTLTATANNDYLISLDVNPTFVSGAFTGVQNTTIRTISGSNLFNTLSGNTIIGSGADSGAFKLDVYGASRVVLNSNTTGAIATVTGVDLTYGLRVNLERSASSKSQFGTYSRVQGGANTNTANYGVYGESFGGGLNYGGYFVANGSGSANRTHIGVLGEALNYNGTSTVSGVGGFFQISTSIASGTAIPIIGNVTSDTAPTGTLKYLDLRLAGTSQFFVERNANRNRPAMMIGGTTIDNSAIIQADSTTQGFLPPRMTGAQGTAIASPATGLIIYATSANGAITTAGWWGYNGATWVQLG